MATHLENFTAIIGAAIGSAPTNNQLATVADAALSKVTDRELLLIFPAATRETLTANQRAAIANIVIRKLIRRMVRTFKVAEARIANIPAVQEAANDETI